VDGEGGQARALPASSRAGQMGTRLLRTARERGVTPSALPALELAHRLAMEPRVLRLADDHDPLYLHPGRSALILLMDVAEEREEVLAASLLVESEVPDLRVPGPRIEEVMGGALAEAVAAVPGGDDEALAERLLTAAEEVRLIALAERLDHLRHAHLWSDHARRREAHQRAIEVYLPIALRTHAGLARRYQWWSGMFARRYLR